MRSGPKIVLIVTCAALVAAGGYSAFTLVDRATGGPSSVKSDAHATERATTPPSSEAAVKLARAFLDSWASGPAHYSGAASDTDAPDTAADALKSYHDGLKLGSVSFSDVTAAGADPAVTGATKVTFKATAQVAGGAWSYPGSLDVTQTNGGTASVHWSQTVLYSGLKDGQQLAAGALPADASDITVTDADGTPLTAAKYPSLGDILSQLKTRFASKADKGSQGTGVQITDSGGTHVRTLKEFTKGKGGKLRTTLDAGLQAAAEQAVRDSHIGGKAAGVVAIDHSNGHVKAIAYSGNQGDIAINGWTAPGSTMKIITAAALIDKAGLKPSTPAPCPTSVQVNGQVFHNVDDEHASGSTLSDAFKMSCNTAFIKLVDNAWQKRPEGFTAIGDEARSVFGLGSWSIGVASKDPQIVDPPNGDRNLRAGDAIGQGNVAVSPLVMASVAATVRHGGFEQPILVPGLAQTSAKQQISATTAQYLQQMMRATAQGGTAAPRVADLPGTGAKTGTAEVGANSTNGWFTAYNPHLAVAAEVIGGGTGVDSAGYVVRDVLLADR